MARGAPKDKTLSSFSLLCPQFGGAVDLAAVAAAIRIGGVDSRWQIFCGQRSEKLDRVLSLGAPLAITR